MRFIITYIEYAHKNIPRTINKLYIFSITKYMLCTESVLQNEGDGIEQFWPVCCNSLILPIIYHFIYVIIAHVLTYLPLHPRVPSLYYSIPARFTILNMICRYSWIKGSNLKNCYKVPTLHFVKNIPINVFKLWAKCNNVTFCCTHRKYLAYHNSNTAWGYFMV